MADEEITRTERLLAMLVLHSMAEGAPQADKCVLLNRAGFDSAAIADLLDTSTAVVNQSLYMARQSKGKKSAKKVTKTKVKATKKKSVRKTRPKSVKKRAR
jgi:hypothetical protein